MIIFPKFGIDTLEDRYAYIITAKFAVKEECAHVNVQQRGTIIRESRENYSGLLD